MRGAVLFPRKVVAFSATAAVVKSGSSPRAPRVGELRFVSTRQHYDLGELSDALEELACRIPSSARLHTASPAMRRASA